MLFRNPDHWLFAAKTFLAAILALLVALWLDLPRPYWALGSVYIASQPLAGATRSKAFYRALGTMAGAGAAVAMVPNLVNAPLLLILTMAAWSGLCLYFSLLDRTPRAYAFMLAGYTASIVGLPAVDAPDTIFDIALSRTEEILIGIVSAAIVSGLLFPRAVGPVVAERVEAWLRDAHISARDALRREENPASEAHWLRLLADATQIEGLARHLPFESNGGRRAMFFIERLLPRILLVFPHIAAVQDRLRALESFGGPSPQTIELAWRADAALDPINPPPGPWIAALRKDIDARMAAPLAEASWRELNELNLLLRLRDLLDLLADCRSLAAALARDAASLPAPLSFPIESRVESARHDDRHAAALAAVTLALTVGFSCFLWIIAEWPEGAVAAMMAAIAGALFASQEDPTPSIFKFAKWGLAAVCLSGVYLFCVLPHAHSFETLALTLAPGFLLMGLLIAEPRTLMIGLPLGVLTPIAMALQGSYASDLESFLNTGLAMVAGLGISAVVCALTRTVDSEARAFRFLRANRLTLAHALDAKSRRDAARAMGLMFDRLALLAPIAHAVGRAMPEAMRDLRAGLNLLEAKRAHAAMAPSAQRAFDALLARLQRHQHRDAPLAADVRVALDRALGRLAAAKSRDKSTLLALVGLRRCLFPEEPPPRLPFCGANP